MSLILETRSLTKEYYKGAPALKGVDIHVERGQIYGLIGKQGAGKSTLLKIISGHLLPSSGELIFPEGRPSTGSMIEFPGVYPNLTVADNLAIKLKAMDCYSKKNLEELIQRTGMGYWKNLKVRVFSRNILMKFGVSMALAGDPELILLDEPFEYLEKEEVTELKQLLKDLKSDGRHTIIITSAMLDSLSGLAECFGLLEYGKLIREDEEMNLSAHLPGHIVLRTDDIPASRQVLEKMGIFAYQTQNAYTIFVMEQLDRSSEIIQELVKAGIQVYECAVARDATDEFYFSSGEETEHHD